jgi:hypothetical protein
MMTALAIGALLLSGVYQLVRRTSDWMRVAEAQNRAVSEAQYAFDRMVRAAAEGRVLILPIGAAVRNHFAVTLPASIDRNGDRVADADNDGDGLIDEDPGNDLTHDGAAGLFSFDDDQDGNTDEGLQTDDDEDGSIGEDSLDLLDNDGDGRIDEDPDVIGDGDGDGKVDEDGYDASLYYLQGTTLQERVPVPWDVNGSGTVTGQDVVTSPLLENVSLLETRREEMGSGATILHLKMNTLDARGEVTTFETSVVVGGRS